MLLDAVLSLARQAVNIDTGSAQSSTSTIVLFVTRLLCHVEHYVSLLLRKRPGIFGASPYEDVRDLDLPEGGEAERVLKSASAALRGFLYEGKAEMRTVLAGWYQKLSRACEANDNDKAVDANTRLMCSIQCHQLLMLRNAPVDETNVTDVVASLVFLTNRKQWNVSLTK